MKKRGPWNDRFYKYCLVYCNISAIFGPNFAFLKAKKIGLASPFESELSSPSRVRVSEKGPSLQVRAQSPRLGSTPMGKRQLFNDSVSKSMANIFLANSATSSNLSCTIIIKKILFPGRSCPHVEPAHRPWRAVRSPSGRQHPVRGGGPKGEAGSGCHQQGNLPRLGHICPSASRHRHPGGGRTCRRARRPKTYCLPRPRPVHPCSLQIRAQVQVQPGLEHAGHFLRRPGSKIIRYPMVLQFFNLFLFVDYQDLASLRPLSPAGAQG